MRYEIGCSDHGSHEESYKTSFTKMGALRKLRQFRDKATMTHSASGQPFGKPIVVRNYAIWKDGVIIAETNMYQAHRIELYIPNTAVKLTKHARSSN